MDDAAAVELERAIVDAATLLMRVDKYRRGREPDALAIRRAVADVGARARRSHRLRTGGESMAALCDAARALVADLEGLVLEVRGSRVYQDAVAAYSRGDEATLRPLLVQIFAGLSPGPTAGEIFAPLDWSGRRGPRAPEELLAAIDAVRDAGFAASGDVLEPGVDPELPAVAFTTSWPDGAPIALGCRLEGLPVPSIVGPAGEILVHRPHVRLPFEVVFHLDRGAVDEWVDDPTRYRQALTPLLERRGYVTRTISTPATP